ncbi:thiopeptide-type bacteriocin biosynthesis protein [Lysinibacillus fusiformis]|uniref:thiopeptide-type bacteriocin biosynthesis protein n=1 Tax=Lysinibacillus fusiformis TaxID=28031 RepID=UPI003D070061
MWVSKHLFIHDYVLIEEFLKECLLPYLDREKVRYFFIRYWDGGPHIRLRYQTAQEVAKKIEKDLEHLLESFHLKHSSHSFQAISYDEAIIQTEGIVPTAPYPNFSIQAIEYVPELNRYGGEAAMSLSEELFVHSSKFAGQIIQKLNRTQRYVLAIDLMYNCTKIAQELGYIEKHETMFHAYREIWTQFSQNKTPEQIYKVINNRIDQLKNGELAIEFYQPYLKVFKSMLAQIKLCQTTMEPKYAFYIVISHLHMLNNRLGISPEYEFIFSDAFLKAG